MAQQTAMQKLLTNLEGIDIKVPQGIKDIYLQMEKEQIVKAYSNGSNDRLKNRINEQYYNETYGGQGSPDTSPNTQNK